jgi:DNA polymerase IV (DinB-like DNA polymerase)
VHPPFDVHTRERSLSGPVDDPGLVEETALELLEEFAGERVRKVGVRVSNLTFGAGEQARLDGYDAEVGRDPASDADADDDPRTSPDPGGRRGQGQVPLSEFDVEHGADAETEAGVDDGRD